MSFPRGWCFYKWAIFFTQLLCYYGKNRWNSRLIVKNMNISWDYLINEDFCMCKYIILLKIGEICYFLLLNLEYEISPWMIIFKMHVFFFMNMPLFCWKSAKFATNYHNMNIPSGWNFKMCDFFPYKYAGFFFTYFQRNLQLIMKIWTLYGTDIF